MKRQYLVSCAVAAVLSGWAGAAAAQAGADSSGAIAEIVVTAQRRDQSVQKVPETIQAITGATLQTLNITTLDDLLRYTPNVTYGNNGPGQGNIFMRGLSNGFAGNQSSATIGQFPNVALYLDDESMQFPARNADIYLADMQRVEVLEGPQGTLFGGGAEAGALRYITNKPKLNTFEGSVNAGYSLTTGGDPSTAVTAVLNVPVLTDKLAVRAVIYDDRQGGYIDNVPNTFTRSNSDPGNAYLNISPGKNGLCPNGGAPGPAGCTIGNAVAEQANNYAIAGKAQNPVTHTGARISALYDINNDWNILISESVQNLDAEGLSVEYPVGSDFQTLKPLQVTAFSPSYDKDNYTNSSWTVNGKVGDLKAVYTGSYLLRNIRQQIDYTNYSRTAYGTYYTCSSSVGLGRSDSPTTCYSPVTSWMDIVRNTHLSNEFRLSTPDDWRFRAIGGLFEEDFRIYDDMNFNYRTIPSCNATTLAAAQPLGALPCVGNDEPYPGTTQNHPGVRSNTTGFGEDVTRGYDQAAVFGSFDYDIIPKVLTITAGTRWYQYSESEFGSVYQTGTNCVDVLICEPPFKDDIDAHHDKKAYTGFKSRASITWNVTPNTLTYFTFSQGFRPGGFNRIQKSVIADIEGGSKTAQFKEPNSYAPDALTNYEIGLKTQTLEHRLLLNLSAYYMQWDNSQLLLYNPLEQINTTFGLNGPGYTIEGIEAQFVGKLTHEFTLQGSGSYNYDHQSTSPCLVDNISGTASFGKCITEVASGGVNVPFANPFGQLGKSPPFSPRFQGNIRARYDTDLGPYKAFGMVGGNYTDGMYNQPSTYPSGAGLLVPTTTYLRYYQPSYYTVDMSAGLSGEAPGGNKWTAELYATNLNNSHASTFTSSAQFIKSEVPIRPRVFGIKMGYSF